MTSIFQNVQSDDTVLLQVTHSNIKSFSSDLRFSLSATIESVKEKLWSKCGTAVDSMRLELHDDRGEKVCDLVDNYKSLGFFSPHNGFRLNIVDLDPSSVSSGGWLEDTSLVEKYSISEENYNKLDCNFRKFKEKIVSQNPEKFENKISDDYMKAECANIKVGERCEVEPGAKRGIVKFVGRAEEGIAPGFWVGVQYDEPLGKHNGTIKGKTYFECPSQHGALLRPDKVRMNMTTYLNSIQIKRSVGDYPERDPFEDEEI